MTTRITRDAFLFLTPKTEGQREDFAQCGPCRLFVPGDYFDDSKGRCVAHGSAVEVDEDDSCGFMLPWPSLGGKPNPEVVREHAAELKKGMAGSVTPQQSGLVSRRVQCHRCEFEEHAATKCGLYDRLNQECRDLFDLNTIITPNSCCNAQEPKAEMTAKLFDDFLKKAIEQPGINDVLALQRLGQEIAKQPSVGGVHIPSSNTGLIRREFRRHDNNTAKTPLQYHGSALAQIRPDQVPRVLAAMTDRDDLPIQEMKLADLTAVQNRIDEGKAKEIAGSSRYKSPPVVVHLGNGRNLVMDGHHRLAAEWWLGRDTASVRYKDVGRLSNALKHDAAPEWSVPIKVTKLDAEAKQVFGWASVVEQNGQLIIDKQGDIIPVAELEAAAYDFALNSRSQGDMHDRSDVGRLIESMVFTHDKQKALGIDLGKVGWWVGFQVDDDELWQAHKRGDRPQFSIGGRGVREEIES